MQNDEKTRACIRCGRWHTDMEELEGRRLSCTEVKELWTRVRRDHSASFGHVALITDDEAGNWICITCKRKLLTTGEK